MTAAILILLLAGTSPPGGSVPDPCRVLTSGEVGEISGGRIAATKGTRRFAGGFEISDCFYRSEAFQDSVSVEVTRRATNTTGSSSSSRSVREHWTAMFHAEPGDEDDGPRGEAGGANANAKEKEVPPRPVEGVGDEAFWLSNPASGALYVLKGDAYLRISVGGAADETVKQRRATELARKALGRL